MIVLLKRTTILLLTQKRHKQLYICMLITKTQQNKMHFSNISARKDSYFSLLMLYHNKKCIEK